MPPFGPISRSDLIAALQRAGFDGPRAGRKHDVMYRGNRKVRVPNPHKGDIAADLLARILRQAGHLTCGVGADLTASYTAFRFEVS